MYIHDEPAEVYHDNAKNYLTSHWLADFRRCPLLYRKKRLGLVPESKQTTAFAVGEALHTLVLEGREVFNARYAIGGPVNPKTEKPYGVGTKAYEAWADEQGGKSCISLDQAALVEQMAASVKAHQVAKDLLSEGKPEVVVRSDMRGLACQCRIDWLRDDCIIDLKTCRDLDDFEADFEAYGYAYQMAFYCTMADQEDLKTRKVFVVAVEKCEPFRCGVWYPGKTPLQDAAHQNAKALDEIKTCIKTEVWPTRYEELKRIAKGTNNA